MLYSGWSLLATARGLPRGQRIAVTQPCLLQPDSPKIKRMVVTAIAEIADSDAETRRFLLKTHAIDADKDAAGLRDTLPYRRAARQCRRETDPRQSADFRSRWRTVCGTISAMPRSWPVSAGRRRYSVR
jgi:hypothetical protein